MQYASEEIIAAVALGDF